MKNTRKEILTWIHSNLGEIHRETANNIFKSTWITEAVLAGIVWREYGFLIPRKVNAGWSFVKIASRATGDGGHGRSFYQIDDRSYPIFVRDTPLSDVKAYCIKACECLEEKRKSLESWGWTKTKLGRELFERAILASYNCGQGNVNKVLKQMFNSAGKQVKSDDYIDSRTYQKDYSRDVQISRYLYYDLFNNTEDEDLTAEEIKAGRESQNNSAKFENAKAIEGHDELTNTGAHKAIKEV